MGIVEFKMMNEEELKVLIKQAAEELEKRTRTHLASSIENAINAIDELIKACHNSKIAHLGDIFIEDICCSDCDASFDVEKDILYDNILTEVIRVLLNYKKKLN